MALRRVWNGFCQVKHQRLPQLEGREPIVLGSSSMDVWSLGSGTGKAGGRLLPAWTDGPRRIYGHQRLVQQADTSTSDSCMSVVWIARTLLLLLASFWPPSGAHPNHENGSEHGKQDCGLSECPVVDQFDEAHYDLSRLWDEGAKHQNQILSAPSGWSCQLPTSNRHTERLTGVGGACWERHFL